MPIYERLGFGQIYEFNNPLTVSANKILAVPPGAKYITVQSIPEGSPSAVNINVYQSFDANLSNAFPISGVGSTSIAGNIATNTVPFVAPYIHILGVSRTGGTNTKILVCIVRRL